MRLHTLIVLVIGAAAIVAAAGYATYSIYDKFRIDGTYGPSVMETNQSDHAIKSAVLTVHGNKGHLHVEYISQVMDTDVRVIDREWLNFSIQPVGPGAKFVQLDFTKDLIGPWICVNCIGNQFIPGRVPLTWGKI